MSSTACDAAATGAGAVTPANTATTTTTAETSSVVANVPTLPPICALSRFLYLSTDRNVFTKTRDLNLTNIQTRLACAVTMGQARADLPISLIKKAYQSKCLLRNDEVLAALAFCARQNQCAELRQLAYKEAVTIIDSPANFLLFIKLYVNISVKLYGNNKRGFANGLRKVIKKWYEQYNAVELANMFGEHRGLYKWTHKGVWKLTHMKTTPVRQSGEDDATIIDTDREHVIKFLFKNGQEYLNYLSTITEPLGPGAARMKNLQIYKTNENIADAINQIHEHGFTVEQTPSHLLDRVEIWDALLPSMSYSSLLKYLHTLKDHAFLNPNHAFAEKYITALSKLDHLEREQSKICPVHVFILKRLYEKNARYLETTKAVHYDKKIARRNAQTNERVTKQLNILFEHLLVTSEPAPAKYFVTIDLRNSTLRRHVLRNKHINCLEASVLLSYAILKRERGALLYTYTDNKENLLPLHDEIPKTSYEAAFNYCVEKTFAKTHQSLKKPMEIAIAEKKKIDVFVVIVDSVARFCRQGQVPMKEFTEYKKQFNPQAKFVVVNLDRPEPDLVINTNADSQGFFEICGFAQEVPKILHLLGKHCFS